MFRLFQALSMFDWITPIIGITEQLKNDPVGTRTWTFFVPYRQSLKAGHNAIQIKGLMKQAGIKTWGHQITNGKYFFSVSTAQANWAVYNLIRNRVPLTDLSYPPKFKEKCLRKSKPSFIKWVVFGRYPK